MSRNKREKSDLQRSKDSRAIARKHAIENGVWMRKPMTIKSKKTYSRKREKKHRREDEQYDD